MRDYHPLPETQPWIDDLMASTGEVVSAHQKTLGHEAEVFWDAMGLISRCVQEPLRRDGGVKGELERAKLTLVLHGFHLMMSSWESALQGRFSAAANNIRSIAEIPDYLLALSLDRTFAENWMAGRGAKHPQARRIIAKALAQERPTIRKEWVFHNENAHKGIQPYSHVSSTSVVAALGQGRARVIVGLGGLVEPEKLRALVALLAQSALALLGVSGETMLPMLTEREDWEAKAKDVIVRGDAVLGDLARDFQEIMENGRNGDPYE